MSRRKGVNNERKLRDLFLERGWYAQRAGASGGGGQQALPDVLVMSEETPADGIDAYAIELKSWADGTGRLEKAEIAALREVKKRSGATPLIVVWPDLRSFEGRFVFAIEDLCENNKSYSVRKSQHAETQTLTEWFEQKGMVTGCSD